MDPYRLWSSGALTRPKRRLKVHLSRDYAGLSAEDVQGCVCQAKTRPLAHEKRAHLGNVGQCSRARNAPTSGRLALQPLAESVGLTQQF